VKPVAVPVDAERATMDYLIAQLPTFGQDVTVGITIPTVWLDTTKPHVQVALDGIPSATYPISAAATIRLTAWAKGATTAKALVGLAQGIMLAHPGGGGIQNVVFLTGTLPARDSVTKAELASATVRVRTAYIVA